jgi:hypothetical protein
MNWSIFFDQENYIYFDWIYSYTIFIFLVKAAFTQKTAKLIFEGILPKLQHSHTPSNQMDKKLWLHFYCDPLFTQKIST